MSFPVPRPGLVIRYSYLWLSEYRRGQEEGVKDRPCVVLLTLTENEGEQKVVVLPVTHTPPRVPAHAVEIPAATKRRLGLDDDRSWIVLTESNRFAWPGPDLRPATPGDAASIVHGFLPQALFDQVRVKWLALVDARKSAGVVRTE